jgi:1,4-alpha-glucan branching enzyme
MKKSVLKKIEFQLAAAPGSQVFVAGTFNNWDSEKTRMKDNPASGHYETVIALPPGKHEYRFVVDGDWCVDPNGAEQVSNVYGSLNSVVTVTA